MLCKHTGRSQDKANAKQTFKCTQKSKNEKENAKENMQKSHANNVQMHGTKIFRRTIWKTTAVETY